MLMGGLVLVKHPLGGERAAEMRVQRLVDPARHNVRLVLMRVYGNAVLIAIRGLDLQGFYLGLLGDRLF
jgi:hypothetical protein